VFWLTTSSQRFAPTSSRSFAALRRRLIAWLRRWWFVPGRRAAHVGATVGADGDAWTDGGSLAVPGALPEYPLVALRGGWQGEVHFLVHVTAAGAVEMVRIQSSSGYALLDATARESVRSWRFPQDQAASICRVRVRFSLGDPRRVEGASASRREAAAEGETSQGESSPRLGER